MLQTKPRKKKCKAISCRQWFRPQSTLQVVCCWCCAIEYAREQEAKAERRWLRERKEKLKTLQDWIDDAQKVVNKLVVLEDKQKGCISCDTGMVTDAGHYFHRGSKYRTSWLTLDRRNLTGQCRSCNSYKGGGNQHEYRLGYIDRYGQEAFEALEEAKRREDCGEVPKPTIEEVQAFIKQAKARIKEARDGQP